MLVLTRKKGQKLIINDNIEVTIIETRGESVKIGIKAPREVTIFREEIYEEIKKANEQAQKQNLAADLEELMKMNALKKSAPDTNMNKIQSFTTRLKNDSDK